MEDLTEQLANIKLNEEKANKTFNEIFSYLSNINLNIIINHTQIRHLIGDKFHFKVYFKTTYYELFIKTFEEFIVKNNNRIKVDYTWSIFEDNENMLVEVIVSF